MNALGREALRGWKKLWRDTGRKVFTYNGADYPCVANEAQSSKIFGVGGFALEADLALFTDVSQLPTGVPEEKKTITFNARKYRVDKRGLEPGESILKLLCNDPNKSA